MTLRQFNNESKRYSKVLYSNGKWVVQCPICQHRTPTPDWAIDHRHIDSIFVCEKCHKQSLIPAGAVKEGMDNALVSTMECVDNKKSDG